MKETTKMSRAIGQLERMYRDINADFFSSSLPVPIITIQSSKGTWGHMTRSKIWKRKDEEAYEMNIAAEVASGIIEEIIDTMIHEMIHMYCRENNIQETSRNGAYHNGKFKELAEERGLICFKTEKSGWNTKGEGNDKLIEYALSKDWNELKLQRNTPFSLQLPTIVNGVPAVGTATHPTSNSRKYQCPNCKNSVRATKIVNIICGDCKVKMEEVVKH